MLSHPRGVHRAKPIRWTCIPTPGNKAVQGLATKAPSYGAKHVFLGTGKLQERPATPQAHRSRLQFAFSKKSGVSPSFSNVRSL